VNCLEFERLLDEGAPEGLPEAARAHARTCASCARSLARARSLERSLAHHFSADVPAPPGFVDRVMARVERGEARGVRWLTLPSAMPWWTRVATDPAVVLALATVALFVWRSDLWLAGARVAWEAFAGVPGRAADWFATAGFTPVAETFARAFSPGSGVTWAVTAGFVLGVAPLVLLGGWLAWRAGERLVAAVGAWR
jgi:hypothetical protein